MLMSSVVTPPPTATPVPALAPLSPQEAAGTVAAVATSLADLHEAGRTHGDVRGEAVVVGLDGLVELLPGPGAGTAADDIAAAGRLVERLCELCPPPPPPPRRGWPSRGRLLHPPEPVAALRSLVEWASHAEPDRRPSARSLAAAALDRVPGACLPCPRAPDDAPAPRFGTPRARAPRRRLLVVLTTVVLAVVAAVELLVPSHTRHRPVAGPRPAGPPADYLGGVLAFAGTRYAVGQPGDVVAVADWACSGQATVALLRPGTGQVWLFPSWAEEGRDASARLVGQIDRAVGLAARPGADPSCPALEVRRAGASATVLALQKGTA